MMRILAVSAALCCMVVLAAKALNAADSPATPAKVAFARDVYPLLKARCFQCHQGADASSGYRLDLRAELTGESTGEPLVKIGDSGKSRLIHMVTGAVPGKRMPPKSKGEPLTETQVALLRNWIDQGLDWDDQLLPPARREITHWAFKPVGRPAVPKVKNADWVRNPVDAFISAKHAEKGLTPAPEGSRRVLIRKLSLDLTGLPPTPEEVDAFEKDAAPDAYEKLVDRLLASPHYGERWARHWLDVARWAESEGYESNHARLYAWRYRDYVVKSLNEDKPFDQFVRQQLAGDELPTYSDENLIATGFLAAARLSSNEEDKARQRNDVLVDVVNATSATFLGLTMNCCQCHSHKFDPLPARDYYRFQGFFVKGQPGNHVLRDPGLWSAYEKAKPPEYDAARKLQESLFAAARADLIAAAKKSFTPETLKALEVPADRRTPEQEKLAREADLKFQFTPGRIEKAIKDEDKALYGELKKKLEAIEKKMPDKPQTWAFYSPVTSPDNIAMLPMKGFYPLPYDPKELASAKPYLLHAGDVHRRGAELEPGWPGIFGPMPKATLEKPRLALADWLTNPANPLTFRVYVNRLWQYHFGRGIVATPNDFGTKGAEPTHPELLDWLAGEFVRSGLSTKHMHRLIVCSNTYRQAATPNAANAKADPDNTLYWRWSPRRLEAEAIRDSMLAVSGELDRTLGGASSPADGGKGLRRSLYLFQKRDVPPPLPALFDLPAAAAESCARRHTSTVPLQSLFLLNNEFAVERAKAMAKRVQAQAGDDRARAAELAFRITLGRAPDDAERAATARFFRAYDAASSADSQSSLVYFCQALLNLNEFVYLE